MREKTKNSGAGRKWKFLSRLLPVWDRDSLLGDLLEIYEIKSKEQQPIFVKIWFSFMVIKSIPKIFSYSIYWEIVMFKNYMIVAFRNLKRYKMYSLINISGLAIGIAFFLLAVLYSAFEFSFDSFHKNSDRIYGVVQQLPSNNEGVEHSAIIPTPFLSAMTQEFPEIEKSTMFFRSSRRIIKQNDNIFYENELLFVKSNFPIFFNFEMITGNPESVLSEPFSIILTPEAALKYFGEKDPIGKYLTVDNKVDLKVTGIIEKAPSNSSIKYSCMVSMETARNFYSWLDDWTVNAQAVFVQLPQKFNPQLLEGKFPSFLKKYINKTPDSPQKLYLMPLTDFHAKKDIIPINSYMRSNMPYEILFWYLAMGSVLLIVVCINFMNLSTARYTTRTKEVGLRKVIGAQRKQLVSQFLGESVFICIISLPIALLIYEFLRPSFINFFGFEMNIALWDYPNIALLLVIATIFLGVFAGSYPAFYLSKFTPVKVLTGSRTKGKKGSMFRKILVVSQFLLSIIVIIFTFAIKEQSNYLLETDLGYNRENVIMVQIGRETRSKVELLKDEFTQHQNINYVSSSIYKPVNWDPMTRVIPEGFDENNKWTMSGYGIDYDFIELLDMKIIKGRSFSKEYAGTDHFILNETAVKHLQWKDPIGKKITMDDTKGTVIGVVNDFLFYSAHFEVKPSFFFLGPKYAGYILIKYSPTANMQDIVTHLQNKWKKIEPELPLQYSTLQSDFAESNRYIQEMQKMFGVLGFLALIISGLGLLGLASYSVGRRTKEIGIRKVLGAAETGIVKLLLTEFLKMVIFANFIAWPLAYLGLNKFMQYAWAFGSTDISINFFLITALLTFFAAIISVAYQTLKAARINPVESLKYE